MSDAHTQEDALDKIVERVQKLLALGKRGGTEAEAAAAMAKAQKLLEEHNLTAAQVEGTVAGSARREKAAQAGGQYVYQRELWRSVSRLNFCMHLNHATLTKLNRRDGGHRYVYRPTHLVIGRVVNTRATIAMATYLEAVTDRLCRERLEVRSGAGATPGELNSQFYSSWAVGFREGVSDRLIQKIEERRDATLKAENKKRAEAERAGVSTSGAVTLSLYKDAETDANIDFLHGAGTAARWAASRAERAAEEAEEDRRYAEWATANPVQARKEAEQARKERERASRRPPATRKVNGSGYWAGHDAAEKVGIDPQADSANTRRIGR